MKKIFAILACFAVSLSLFAVTIGDNPDDPFERERFEAEKTTTRVIIPENNHCTDKNASIRIEYSPMYDEVRIYYETLYVTYDRGEANNAVIAVLQDFEKEYKYQTYKYLKPEVIKYFKDDRGQRKAQWSAYLKLNR